MKRIFLSLAAAALCSAAQLRAEEKQPANQNAGDSVRMYRLQEVEVTATRATPNTPVAYSDIRREEIARNSYGTDIPTLLALTPSMIATNETGIGIGGTMDRAAVMSKIALTRSIDSHNPMPEYAKLEDDLLELINETGIGPQLGGTTSCLGVNIEWGPTHIAGLPVAVTICCHACRHAKRVL